MHFRGRKAPSNTTSDPSRATNIDETAMYIFDGKGYRLSGGRNPVPDI